jgi:hypothetical protein
MTTEASGSGSEVQWGSPITTQPRSNNASPVLGLSQNSCQLTGPPLNTSTPKDRPPVGLFTSSGHVTQGPHSTSQQADSDWPVAMDSHPPGPLLGNVTTTGPMEGNTVVPAVVSSSTPEQTLLKRPSADGTDSAFVKVHSERPPVKIYRKQKEPDKFDGKSVDWVDFCTHFETVANWNGWSKTEKASQLTMCLRGTAQRLLGDLASEQLCDYDRLKSVLTQRFAPAERITAYRCEFRVRKRERGESVTDYGYALRRLAMRAFPKITWEAREDIVVDQYINGLGTLEIKRHVQFAHPLNLDGAISAAVEFEAFDGTQQTARKPQSPTKEADAVCSLQTSKAKTDTVVSGGSHEMQAAFEKNAEIMKQLTETIAKLSVPIQRAPPRGPPRDFSYATPRGPPRDFSYATPRGPPRDFSHITCFECREKGHFRRTCPQLINPRAGNDGNGSQAVSQSASNTVTAVAPQTPEASN